MHHHAPSREEGLRQQDQHSYLSLHERRERDELDRRREMERQLDLERQRNFERQKEYERQRELAQLDADARYQMHRQQQQEQDRQFPRGPPTHPLHLPAFNGGAFGPSRAGGLGARDQAIRETEAAMEEERRALHDDRRRNDHAMMREREAADIQRRRHGDSLLYSRHTPLGGGFPHPPARL